MPTNMLTDTTLDLDAAIAAMHEVAESLGRARAREMELEDERALVKRDAVRRLVESGAASSATAAEKIVEQDEEYAAHRRNQREQTIYVQTRWSRWEAARARVWAIAKGGN
jgi:tyrosyl-tRNA synthetase